MTATFSGTIGVDVTTAEAGRLFGVGPKTVRAWMTTGLPWDGGEYVRLPGVKLGKDWRTGIEALSWFVCAINGIPDPGRIAASIEKRLAELRGQAAPGAAHVQG